MVTKESQLRCRSMRNAPPAANNTFFEITHKAHRGDYVSIGCDSPSIQMYQHLLCFQDGPTGTLCESKLKQIDNPFIDTTQRQTMVDMKGSCSLFVFIKALTFFNYELRSF